MTESRERALNPADLDAGGWLPLNLGAPWSVTEEDQQIGHSALLTFTGCRVRSDLICCLVYCSRPINPVFWEQLPKVSLGGLSYPREWHVTVGGDSGHVRPPRGRRDFFHSTYSHPCWGVPVPTGLHCPGGPAVQAALWLMGGRACARQGSGGSAGVGAPCKGRSWLSGEAGGDLQTRLLAVSPG